MTDAEKLIAWLREGADELEKAHAILDSAGIPRRLPDADCADVECTLAARISMLATQRDDYKQEVYDQGERS